VHKMRAREVEARYNALQDCKKAVRDKIELLWTEEAKIEDEMKELWSEIMKSDEDPEESG
jgi:hypothetical protein